MNNEKFMAAIFSRECNDISVFHEHWEKFTHGLESDFLMQSDIRNKKNIGIAPLIDILFF